MEKDNYSKKFGRRYIIYAILIACAASLSYLYIDLLDVEEDLVKSEFNYLESKVIEDLEDFFMPISKDYNYMVQLMLLDQYDFSDSSSFMARFVPLLNNSMAISSVMIANASGEEMMLLKMEDHFIYRHTRSRDDELINRKYRIQQSDDLTFEAKYQDEVSDYDPRERPWYKTAENSNFGELNWTENPYLFFTTKEVGITLSAKFTDQNDSSLYVAFDVKLNDISELTESLTIGKNGMVFVCSKDSFIVGLPKIARLDSIASHELLLKHMKDFPSKRVQFAFSSLKEIGVSSEPKNINYESEHWWIHQKLFEVNNLDLTMIMIGREKDFKGEVSRTRNILLGAISLIGLFFYVIMRFYAQQRKNYHLVKDKNQVIEDQKAQIEENLSELNDSISYAEKVQAALLSDNEQLPTLFPESFILFLPKGVVSGDFYWFAEHKGKRFIAAADCTGHGISGALLSVMGTNFLEDIVIGKDIDQASVILGELRAMVVNAFNVVNGGKRHDGMDIALLVFDDKQGSLQYSGAKNPLYLIRDGELVVYPADRMAVGFEDGEALSTPFKDVDIQLKKNDRLYVFSDGYADQFGGEKGKKFMYGKLKKFLLEIHQKEMDEQKELLNQNFQNWKADEAQVDDVIIIGIRI